MATPLDMAQQVLALINAAAGGDPLQTHSTGCPGATDSNSTAPIIPKPAHSLAALPTSFDITSILTFLMSFSALTNWIKFAAFGAVLEFVRRIVFHFYYKIYNAFFITALFEDDDVAYDWMMVWLSQQPAWRAARDVQITSKSFGLNISATQIEGEEEDPMDALSSTRTLSYLPSVDTTFTFWYHRRWVRINRSVRETQNYYNSRTEMISICIMSWDHSILNKMMLEAKKAYKDAQENYISIMTSDSSGNWRHMASRPKRPLTSIVLDPGIKDLILEDARDFLLSKSWYTARGIPFRRGYLLYGAPGSGKTSIIHSLAGELGLDVYIISLSRAGLDDHNLQELISDLPEKCIALMEDIDAAFSQTLNRDADKSSDDKKDGNNNSSNSGPTATSTSRISLSGLLNALDGVGAQEGRILFATTNKYNSLDAALCRPGRMDVHIEFKLASKYQATELFKRFYLPDSEIDAAAAAASDPTTSATPASPTPSATEKELPKISDSGYSSVDDEAPSVVDEKSALLKTEIKAASIDAVTVLPVVPHKLRGPKLSVAQVEDLAAQFAVAIPEREVSMAALQGFLMGYKIRPYEAVADAAAWIGRERAEAKEKEEKANKAKKESEEKEKEEKEEKEKKEKEDREKEEKEKKEKEEKERKEKETEKVSLATGCAGHCHCKSAS